MQLSDVDLVNPDSYVERVPFEMFEVLRREAPIYWHPEHDGGPGFWALTRYDAVVAVNRDWERFSSAKGGALLPSAIEEQLDQMRLMMLNMDPTAHTRLRLLVNKGFTPRMIGRIEDHVRDLARQIVDNVAEKGECDFVVDVAAELPLQVIAEMMGVPVEDRHHLFEWSNQMVGSEDPEYATTPEQAGDASMQMYMYANSLAERRRLDPRDDIVTALLTAEVEGERLSELEFDVFFLLLAVAGNETTRNLISHAMLALIENPDQRQLLLDDPTLIPVAVEEFLRWGTPVMHFRRTATCDTEVEGQKIREGDKVCIWYISANRDESVFSDPYRFDVRRTPNEHVAFGGGGPHFCLGANLARLEIRAIFEELLARLPDMQLDLPVQRLRSNFINGIKHMPVAFTPAVRLG
jgi:cholest-4-en-3-one 26-monooxygenase